MPAAMPLRSGREPSGSGTYYGRRSVARPGLRSLIGLRKKIPDEPFAAQAMWIPTTGVKVLVPEAALIPRVVIKSNDYMPTSQATLAPWAPSFRMRSNQWITPEQRDALAAAVGPTLEQLDATFARVELVNGALGLRVDGFRSDPADLDRLIAATGAMADALTEVAKPGWAPGPFDQPLGPFDRSTHPPGYRSFDGGSDRSGIDAMERDAAAMGLVVEDPVALHRRFPHLGLPGTSMGVLAGSLPGSTRFGRLTWQTQSHPTSSMYFRRAAIVAAGSGAPALPVGGTLVASSEMYVAAADGLAWCWTQGYSPGRLDTADLVERALATFREAGVADA